MKETKMTLGALKYVDKFIGRNNYNGGRYILWKR
jgi:hypothetical protein